MASSAQLHAELIGFLRQHSPDRDQRHLVLLGLMVTGLLLSETVCFHLWKARLLLAHRLEASWQRRRGRWLANSIIDVEAIFAPFVLWVFQNWQKLGQTLHLSLDTTVLWNHFCVVVLPKVVHGRVIPLLWPTMMLRLISLLEKTDQLLAGFKSITLLAVCFFPCDELLCWFSSRSRLSYVMRLRGDTDIHGTAVPLGCHVRQQHLFRGQCRGFRSVWPWADGSQSVNMVIAHLTGLPVEELLFLISNRAPDLDLVWSYEKRFCCEQLFRDQISGMFHLPDSGLRGPQRIDGLLLVVAITVLASSLQC